VNAWQSSNTFKIQLKYESPKALAGIQTESKQDMVRSFNGFLDHHSPRLSKKKVAVVLRRFARKP